MPDLDDVVRTILAEAAGEGEEGMYAVASVIMNRAKRRGLSPQAVVNQPKQFTGRWRKDLEAFVAQQSPETLAAAQRAWERAQTDPMPGIDHYLTTELADSPQAPSWSRKMGGRKVLGGHVFMDSTKGPEEARMDPLHTQYPDATDHKIARLNRAMLMSGFGRPLQAEEIEPLLRNLVGVPTSISGKLEPVQALLARAEPDGAVNPGAKLPMYDQRDALFRSSVPMTNAIGPVVNPGQRQGSGAMGQTGLYDDQQMLRHRQRRMAGAV